MWAGVGRAAVGQVAGYMQGLKGAPGSKRGVNRFGLVCVVQLVSKCEASSQGAKGVHRVSMQRCECGL